MSCDAANPQLPLPSVDDCGNSQRCIIARTPSAIAHKEINGRPIIFWLRSQEAEELKVRDRIIRQQDKTRVEIVVQSENDKKAIKNLERSVHVTLRNIQLASKEGALRLVQQRKLVLKEQQDERVLVSLVEDRAFRELVSLQKYQKQRICYSFGVSKKKKTMPNPPILRSFSDQLEESADLCRASLSGSAGVALNRKVPLPLKSVKPMAAHVLLLQRLGRGYLLRVASRPAQLPSIEGEVRDLSSGASINLRPRSAASGVLDGEVSALEEMMNLLQKYRKIAFPSATEKGVYHTFRPKNQPPTRGNTSPAGASKRDVARKVLLDQLAREKDDRVKKLELMNKDVAEAQKACSLNYHMAVQHHKQMNAEMHRQTTTRRLVCRRVEQRVMEEDRRKKNVAAIVLQQQHDTFEIDQMEMHVILRQEMMDESRTEALRRTFETFHGAERIAQMTSQFSFERAKEIDRHARWRGKKDPTIV